MLSALIISNGECECLSNGPDEHGKFQGIIAHSRAHPVHPYMPILSSTFSYGNTDDAVEAMRKAVVDITESVAREIPKDH